MKRKWQGIAVLTISSLIATGCTLNGDASTKTVTISEDVKLESALTDGSIIAKHDGSIPIDVKVNYPGFKGNNIFYNQNKATYHLDLKTMKKEKIADKPFYLLSENGNRALSLVNEEFYVLDFQTNTKQFIGTGSEEYLTYFGDEEGSTVIQIIHKKSDIVLEKTNLSTNQKTSWTISDMFEWDGLSISSFQTSSNGIYIVGKSLEEGYGFYHLTDNREIEQLSPLEKIDSMDRYHFLDEETIIFNDIYNGKSGIYTLNLKTEQVTQLVAGGEDEEGIWVPFYKLSPDKNKILFDAPVQVGKEYKTNVYVAELINGKVSNPSLIMQNADLYAVISYTGYWSQDSNTVFISTTIPGEETIDTVEVFQVQSDK
ncbi:hypothetical protein OR571_05345 [Psychrobacillus sp. NEAU-3TGS]|uniref:hypothetical protein n=1 Tax=Psychrobacillus sp. NEAU-3TGS TaxID=2995412 RepID=UPI002496DB23|nr:hypothetical protein [Psychrobacillus sp. NEAU-3TGS]MDI2586572.1 hypothetical protein [Psychrobacillus sp. NEAU-3TGS]